MQKVLLAAAAFVIGATLGMGMLAALVVIAGFISAGHGGGIGAVAGGIGHWTVLAVPVVCGSVVAWLAMWKLNRVQR